MRLIILLAFAALPLFSQSKGSINGDVTDSSGAVIPNARVKVRAGAIALERDAVTNENGAFIVVGLPAADYTVTVEAAGFKWPRPSNCNLKSGN
jgi:Carboxypeptidase regulatory-like domain